MMAKKTTLIGLRPLQAAFKELDPKNIRQLLRSVNRTAATKFIKKQFISNVPRRTGKGQDSIKVRATPASQSKTRTEVMVGPESSAYYLRFFETGTKERIVKKDYTTRLGSTWVKFKAGSSKGRISAQQPFERAIDSNYALVIRYVNDEYAEVFLKRLRSKIKRVKKKINA